MSDIKQEPRLYDLEWKEFQGHEMWHVIGEPSHEQYEKIKVIEYAALESANAEIAQLKEKLQIAIEALEFECGNRCAIGINPCNSREAIEKIKELK